MMVGGGVVAIRCLVGRIGHARVELRGSAEAWIDGLVAGGHVRMGLPQDRRYR